MIQLKRLGLLGLSLTGLLLFTVPAAAAATPAAASGVGTPSAALPNTAIKGSPAKYSPVKLTATPKWNGTATCTTALESFTITNSTSVSQAITSDGTTLGTIAAGGKAGICINTDQAGKTDTFGLTSNKKAKLSVKVR